MEVFVKRESTEVNTNTIERACLSHNKVTITAGQRNYITCSRSEKVTHDPTIQRCNQVGFHASGEQFICIL